MRRKVVIVLSLFFLACTAEPVKKHAEKPSLYARLKQYDLLPRYFACKCCGVIKLDPSLVAKLMMLKDKLGAEQIYITSGYRCIKHNKSVGGAKSSQHMLGKAADIMVPEFKPIEVKTAAILVGFKYVKLYKKHVHVDVRDEPLKWGEKTPIEDKKD